MLLASFYNPRKHWKTNVFDIKRVKKPSGCLKNQSTGLGGQNMKNAGNLTLSDTA